MKVPSIQLHCPNEMSKHTYRLHHIIGVRHENGIPGFNVLSICSTLYTTIATKGLIGLTVNVTTHKWSVN